MTMVDTTLLQGIVGSRAYGMATDESDVDMLGVYAAPTIEFHGLRPPTGKRATRHATDPDVTMHEAGKFATLALAGNPTVMELLWLPPESYTVTTTLGWQLIALRDQFLSAPRVRDAYLGYATQQFHQLRDASRFPDIPTSRSAKHGRHLLRLVEQGTNLWVTGELTLRVPSAKRVFDFGDRVAAGDIGAAEWIISRARETFDNTPTVLPDKPDSAAVEAWLHTVRAVHYSQNGLDMSAIQQNLLTGGLLASGKSGGERQ